MLIIPAIDIKDGCVVRLTQGKFTDKKTYSRDPVKTAKYWAGQGASLIHVVDLDGAETGRAKNLAMVKEIVKNTPAAVQFGGGARDINTIKTLLGCGIKRVVLGTRAVEDPGFLKKAFKLFKHRIIVSIDAKGQKVFIKGWRGGAGPGDILGLVRNLKKLGMREFIYTDILKDGTLKGPNLKNIKMLLAKTGMKLIASGGICSLGDLGKLKTLQKKGLCGVIIGKALYEGSFTLKEALKRFEEER